MKDAQYRNINNQEILQDSNYGTEGKFLISIHCEGKETLLDPAGKKTAAGHIAEKFWNDIPNHFHSIEIHEHVITHNCFHGILNIDLSGKKVGEKKLYFNVVSQFEIAFGMMVGKKNPFLVEGSIFHVITWFKAASLLEIIRKDCPDFKWKSGYFDFSITSDKVEHEILQMIKNS